MGGSSFHPGTFHHVGNTPAGALEVYLLPPTPWEQVLTLQQRLVFEIGGSRRGRAALIVCEHPPLITIGRQGSHRHVLLEPEQLAARELEVRWTNRGGGCWMHTLGQLAAYPIVSLNPRAPSLDGYRNALYQALLSTLEEFRISAHRDYVHAGVCVGERQIATVGVAIKDWIAYHGCSLNVSAPLEQFEAVQINPWQARLPTSMFREMRVPVRPATVRECLVRQFVEALGFQEYYLCTAPAVWFGERRAVHVATGGT